MSELFKHIEGHFLHKYRAEMVTRFPYLCIEESIDPVAESSYTQGLYSVRVQWGFDSYIRPEELVHMKNLCLRSLKEAMYGDFRVHLYALEKAVYEGDREGAINALGKIWSEVQ